jgi:hypothetical protein
LGEAAVSIFKVETMKMEKAGFSETLKLIYTERSL